MSTEVREFPFSGAYLAKRQKGMLAAFACFPLMAVGLPFAMSLSPECALTPRALWFLGEGMLVFGLCLTPVIVWNTSRIWRRLRARVHEDRLVSVWGKGEFAIPWAEVTAVRKHVLPTGEITRLDVTPASGRTIWLAGLDDMEGLLAAIRQKAPEGVEVQVRPHKVDWSRPLPSFASSLAPCVVLGALMAHQWGLNAYLVVFYLGFGLYFLIAKPVSHTRPRLRWLEVGITWFLLLVGAATVAVWVLEARHGG
jgi:hypothetical protein